MTASEGTTAGGRVARTRSDVFVGCLLGTAVGDALGLPYEGLSPQRARSMLGPPSRHRFFFGRGMVSDDTEHSALSALALIASQRNPELFAKSLACRLRWWLVGLPAGVGLATGRAILKLWIGFPPNRSGVFSAGNGPAMRSGILGAAATDLDHLVALTRASTELTHTDPRALHGALVVALAAYCGAQTGRADGALLWEQLSAIPELDDAPIMALVQNAITSVARGEQTVMFAASMGLEGGVTGFVEHTVPVCVHAWLANPTCLRSAVQTVIQCGGDADTTAAIVGAMAGATLGEAGVPSELLDALFDWPVSARALVQLGKALDGQGQPPALHLVLRLPRNALFFVLVLLHGLRRTLPPYS